MTTEESRYWGSWKGRVIKAIALDGAKTWDDIRDLTGMHAVVESIANSVLELLERPESKEMP